MTEYLYHPNTGQVFEMVRMDPHDNGKDVVDIRTGFYQTISGKALQKITGVNGHFGNKYQNLEIHWSGLVNDYLIVTTVGGKKPVAFRLSALKGFITEPLVKKMEFVEEVQQYTFDRWGHAAIRSVDDLVVGRGYRYVYGDLKYKPDQHMPFVLTGVFADKFTYVNIRQPSFEMLNNINYLHEGHLADSGVVPYPSGLYSANFIIPAATEPVGTKRWFTSLRDVWVEEES